MPEGTLLNLSVTSRKVLASSPLLTSRSALQVPNHGHSRSTADNMPVYPTLNFPYTLHLCFWWWRTLLTVHMRVSGDNIFFLNNSRSALPFIVKRLRQVESLLTHLDMKLLNDSEMPHNL